MNSELKPSQDRISEYVRAVSRSFFFVINQLEEPLRREIQVGYLLFRLGDNIEDTKSLNFTDKQHLLNQLLQAFEQNTSFKKMLEPYLKNGWHGLTRDERELLVNSCDEVIYAFSELSFLAQKSLLQQASIMFTGMISSINRWTNSSYQMLSVKNLEDLELYCYYVAGTVGDYLTDRFVASFPSLSSSEFNILQKQGRSLALVLQITNIIRDVNDDYQQGRIFYPRDLFTSFSYDNFLSELGKKDVLVVSKLLGKWLYNHLLKSEEYIGTLPTSALSVRRFVIIPYVMAIKTMTLTINNPLLFGDRIIKISRFQTKWIIFLTYLFSPFNGLLVWWFSRMRRSLLEKLNN